MPNSMAHSGSHTFCHQFTTTKKTKQNLKHLYLQHGKEANHDYSDCHPTFPSEFPASYCLPKILVASVLVFRRKVFRTAPRIQIRAETPKKIRTPQFSFKIRLGCSFFKIGSSSSSSKYWIKCEILSPSGTTKSCEPQNVEKLSCSYRTLSSRRSSLLAADDSLLPFSCP